MPASSFRYCPMCATALVEKDINQISRSSCPACGFIHFLNPNVVAVVVVHYKDKVLLGKRNIEPAKGLWSFCGGYMELGETVEEAALREVKEEANLDVELESLIGVYSGRDMSHVIIAYNARVLDHEISNLSPQPEEVSQLAFFSWEELPPLAFPVHQQIVLDLKERSV